MKKILIILFVITNCAFSFYPMPFVKDGKVGYIDYTGKIVIEPKFDTPYHKLYVVYGNDSFPSFEFPNWAYFSEDKATVRIAKKFWFYTYGYEYAVINTNGEFVFEPNDDIIGSFNDSVAPYQSLLKTFEYKYSEKFGMINTKGEVFIEPKYDYISQFSSNRALAMIKNKYGYINKNGEVVIPFDFIDAGTFTEELTFAKKSKKYGYIDTTGNFVIPEKYENAYNFINGIARYFDGNFFGYLKLIKSGNYINVKNLTDKKFIDANDFSDGLACVRDFSKYYGYINEQGEYVIEPKFIYAMSFSEDLAVASDGKYFGFINKKGDFVIKAEYDFAQNFKNGIAKVWKNNQLHFINKNNQTIFSFNLKY